MYLQLKAEDTGQMDFLDIHMSNLLESLKMGIPDAYMHEVHVSCPVRCLDLYCSTLGGSAPLEPCAHTPTDTS